MRSGKDEAPFCTHCPAQAELGNGEEDDESEVGSGTSAFAGEVLPAVVRALLRPSRIHQRERLSSQGGRRGNNKQLPP